MIRVKWFNGKIYEEQNEFNLKYSLNDERVIKVEKQIKDLTLEEMTKLNIHRCNQKTREVLVLKGYVNDIPYGDTYKFDDYIDITNLLKE